MKYVTRLSSSRIEAYHTDKDCYRLTHSKNLFEVEDTHPVVEANSLCSNCQHGDENKPGTQKPALRHRIMNLENELDREVTEEDLRQNA